MFDIEKLNKSSFRGVPYYTKDEENSGGHRLTDHSFINGGTEVEDNSVTSEVFTIKGYIGGDDYLTQKQALKDAFDTFGSGTLIDKFYGEIEVYVSTYKISESITRFGLASIDVTYKRAKTKVIEQFDIVYNVDVRNAAVAYFAEDFNNGLGFDLVQQMIKDMLAMWNGIEDSIKFIEDVRDTIQNIKSNIGKVISKIKTTILSIDSLTSEILSIFLSFDTVLDTDLFGADETKSFVNSLRQIIEQNSNIVYDNPAQQEAKRQSDIYINTVIAGLTQTAIVNLENIQFETGDDFGSVKDDILTIMDILEKSMETEAELSIDKIISRQNLLEQYQLSRRVFIQFYTQKYSGLQELKNYDIVLTTDILNLTMERYNDIGRVDEVMKNNDIVDPIFINETIKLLDR